MEAGRTGQDPGPVTPQLNYPGGSPGSMGQYNGGAASNAPQPPARNLTSAGVWTGDGNCTLNFPGQPSVMTLAPGSLRDHFPRQGKAGVRGDCGLCGSRLLDD